MLQVLEMLQTHARAGRVALVNREGRLTYQELDARSDAFAAFLLDRLGEDRSPVLLCGEKERANIQSARFLSENIKGAQLQLITQTGHVVNEETPCALAKHLNEFYSLYS